ncbi:MAG TPA: tRNA (adenosine(37)-N6)-threonylcarbamoyltransferase complex ATPase subunit type 1 TsaE [Arenimonas sp.]|nr:tRNA (adenosine(37)-N6)-threonylcarbamoyltransferase complex ATPase subunit type 1 TsaE [Arenimonas sp.]
MRIYCQNHEATEDLAIKLAEKLPKHMVIYLYGDLGAGKSTFARAFIHALGFEGSIKSPTYTLLEAYPLGDNKNAVHMDLYRISEPDEIDFLALDSYENSAAVMLIEWPEKGIGYIPPADLKLFFSLHEQGRHLDFQAQNKRAEIWLEFLQN